MRKFWLVALFLALCGTVTVAQNAELAGGWDYLHVDSDVLPTQNGIPGGFFVDGTYYFAKVIGLTGDFEYNKKTFSSDAIFTAGDQARTVSFHAGPRVKARIGKVEPFAQALFGVANLQLTPFGMPSESSSKFSMKLGGGVDWAVAPHFALRLGEFNYYYTKFSSTDFSFGFPGAGVNDHQNNVTFGVGVVIR